MCFFDQTINVPLLGVGFRRHRLIDDVLNHITAHFRDGVTHIFSCHELDTLFEDRFTLIVRHVVVFQKVLTDFKVALLDLFLRGLKRLVHPWVNNGFVFLDTEATHNGVETFGREDAQ